MAVARALIAALFVFTAAPASAQDALSKQWTIAFTAPGAKDVVTATVVGDDPVEGAMAFLIHDSAGKLVYSDIWPMAWFHSNIEGPAGRYSPEHALEWIAPKGDGDASAQPSAASFADADYIWLETDAETYERARASGGPVVCYNIAHESGVCAWYDAERGMGVKINGGGV